MDNILLTIIIPTYNMEDYLDKCLTSLIVDDEDLAKKIEVLVVIDGAMDRSSEIAHSYQDKYPHIFRVIDKENGNYGSCINRGLKEATGKYIKVLDADDSFNKENFQKYLYFLYNIDCDVVLTDYMQVDSNERILRTIRYCLPQDRILKLDDLGSKEIDYVLMHGVTYRTSMVKSIGYVQNEGISYTDQEWIFAPIAYAQTIAYFDKIIYKYLIGRNGQTMDPDIFEKNFWMEIKGAKTMVETYLERYETLSVQGRRYMRERIIRRSGIIIWSYFFSQKQTDNYPIFLDYDKYLKDNVYEIWKELGDKSKRCGIPYLKLWRTLGYAKRPWLIKAIRLKDKLGLRRNVPDEK